MPLFGYQELIRQAHQCICTMCATEHKWCCLLHSLYQLWLKALKNPANSVEWILVNPDNHNDPVAQHINVNSVAFMSQFTLVIRQSNGILLYHRLGSQPLPDRPAPPSLKFAHHTCI